MLACEGIAAIDKQPMSLIRLNAEENGTAKLLYVGDRAADAKHIHTIT
jgi:hypothetical protein